MGPPIDSQGQLFFVDDRTVELSDFEEASASDHDTLDCDSYGGRLRHLVNRSTITSFIGIYDCFSASIAARHHQALFVSGFGFAASHYGLPDIGFIAWPDMAGFIQRLRAILPNHHLLVDMDDGYADVEVACHTAMLMETVGASGIILEDQARPRACGHTDDMHIMPIDSFMKKLNAVLKCRKNLFVVARTDATNPDDVLERVRRFAEAGADAVLVDCIKDLDDMLPRIKEAANGVPVCFNQLAGGKSPNATLAKLADLGVKMVNYSTPCLFEVKEAMNQSLIRLKEENGNLEALTTKGASDLKACKGLLDENYAWRKAGHCRP